MGSQVLDIKIVNCGGLRDLMSEMESSFLVSALGLFRNHQDLGKGYPRANVNLVRAYRPSTSTEPRSASSTCCT